MNKFFDFLQSFETKENKPIIEAIKSGYQVCFEAEELPAFTDQALKSQLYQVTEKYKGMFKDTGWGNITNLIKDIHTVIPNAALIKSEYIGDFPHKSKEWTLVGAFQTPKGGFKRAVWIKIIASGAGSGEDPLEIYDITVLIETMSPRNIRDDKSLEYLDSLVAA
jgi:hypothetical protein